jgi:hypothetical protein
MAFLLFRSTVVRRLGCLSGSQTTTFSLLKQRACHRRRQAQTVSFHFGSSDYAASFQDLPVPDIDAIRKSAIDYLDKFDPQKWYSDPVRTCFMKLTT